MNITKERLTEILALHAKWLRDETGGERANLRSADLSGADLRSADLSGANLRSADLSGADLRSADLRSANLRSADLDYSSGIPLHCGGSQFSCDMKLIRQVLAHLATLKCDDPAWAPLRDAIMPEALLSHRASDLHLEKPVEVRT